ncbi:hypothetical protein [Rhodopseudomonas sp.]|uniref:hypothetical protein n=1 Tax=Rhodopseudomonas sp. TaxID=1078 RepID=UPI0039E2BB16
MRYDLARAAVVVEGATPVSFGTGSTTMIVLGILLNIAGLGVICWAIFRLAVFALPFFVGVTAGSCALQIGTAPLGAIAVGVISSACALVLGQYVFAFTRSALVRFVVGALFVLPASVAGYQLAAGIADAGTNAKWWHDAFALIGAVVVGATAWTRLATLQVPSSERLHGESSALRHETAKTSS